MAPVHRENDGTDLIADPPFIHLSSAEQHGLEQVTPLAHLHDQVLELGVLENIVQLDNGFIPIQLPHEANLPLHPQEVFLLHL